MTNTAKNSIPIHREVRDVVYSGVFYGVWNTLQSVVYYEIVGRLRLVELPFPGLVKTQIRNHLSSIDNE